MCESELECALYSCSFCNRMACDKCEDMFVRYCNWCGASMCAWCVQEGKGNKEAQEWLETEHMAKLLKEIGERMRGEEKGTQVFPYGKPVKKWTKEEEKKWEKLLRLNMKFDCYCKSCEKKRWTHAH